MENIWWEIRDDTDKNGVNIHMISKEKNDSNDTWENMIVFGNMIVIYLCTKW